MSRSKRERKRRRDNALVIAGSWLLIVAILAVIGFTIAGLERLF